MEKAKQILIEQIKKTQIQNIQRNSLFYSILIAKVIKEESQPGNEDSQRIN